MGRGRGTSLLLGLVLAAPALGVTCVDRRPPKAERRLVSPAVDAYVAAVQRDLKDGTLACVFGNTLPNTLDTTVMTGSAAGSFIITGDIDAMWLRDSTNQVLPYLPFAKADPTVGAMLKGLVRTQTQQILADPYANAHNRPEIAGPSPNVRAARDPRRDPRRRASLALAARRSATRRPRPASGRRGSPRWCRASTSGSTSSTASAPS